MGDGMMATLYPYIFCEDARKQAAFYAKAFDGEIVSVLTFAEMPNADERMKDKVMHLTFKAWEHIFYMADAVMEPVQRGNGLNLALGFKTEEEGRQVFERLADGGNVRMPFERMFWGEMFGMVEDPFGVRWQVVTEPEKK
jgi:PhnB protein